MSRECDLEIWWMALENNRAPLLYYIKLCASFQSHVWVQTRVRAETLNSGQNWRFFVLDLEIWHMLIENNREPLLYYVKFCGSFPSHGSFQNKVAVWKRSIFVKIGDFLFRVILKLDGWPMAWKNKRAPHLCCFKFVHHFIAINEFNLELKSGNAQFRSKSTTFGAV